MSWLSEVIHQISWSSAGSVIFGAAISATVSYLLQRNSFAEARRQKEADKREDRRTLGLNVFTKMLRVASTLELLKQSLEQAFARAERDKHEGPPWSFVIPLANFPSRVHFEPKELTEIMRLDFNLFNDLGPFDDVHNSLLDIFELYRADRNAMTTNMSAEMLGGMRGSTTLTPEELKKLAPKMAALDTIIEGMIQRTVADSEQAWKILDRLQGALNKEYQLNLRIEKKPLAYQPAPPL